MDTLFFWASKIIWILVSPGNLLVILAIGGGISLWLNHKTLGRWLMSVCAVMVILIAFLPIGEWLISPLENRFQPATDLDAPVDGIILLGGTINPWLSSQWNQPQLNGSAERITGFVDLAIRYPSARLIFTGGSGSVLQQDLKEADFIDDILFQLGYVNHNVNIERESRNTYENAVFSKQQMQPQQGENWILVTSAFHMPRARGVFCGAGWPVTAYPVDFKSSPGNNLRVSLDFSSHLSMLEVAVHEWLGLVVYRISGKTSQLLPGTATNCQDG